MTIPKPGCIFHWKNGKHDIIWWVIKDSTDPQEDVAKIVRHGARQRLNDKGFYVPYKNLVAREYEFEVISFLPVEFRE